MSGHFFRPSGEVGARDCGISRRHFGDGDDKMVGVWCSREYQFILSDGYAFTRLLPDAGDDEVANAGLCGLDELGADSCEANGWSFFLCYVKRHALDNSFVDWAAHSCLCANFTNDLIKKASAP